MKILLRQSHLSFGIALVVATISSVAAAGGYQQPVRMLVPCPAGSPADISARDIARLWSEKSGRQFYVENLPAGAVSASITGDTHLDGRTMLFDLADCGNVASIAE